ncbi:MAG: acyclic terpene utilization AtuA family protein, partial [Deltaproteobacteria bacterium]|nr:acyclic terpene utilization AtuA family protein [Deltaproteobacteria bacterium]
MTDKKTLYDDKLIVANASGFLGDRFTAAKEMVQGGPIDFLTGDYLAELTMAILFRKVLKSPDGGYASTFLRQMEGVMGECLDKNIRVVTNAGGLNPKSLAEKLEEMAKMLGVSPKIAYIEGDNLMGRIPELQEKGETFTHLDKGVALKDANAQPISANAYLGGWGIVEALNQGADIVVGGRLADAAVVMGPAAWKFDWKKDDWDKLAGAATAGHIIECSGQATGGNYSFIHEVPSYQNVGFPIAEMHEDGSFIVTKHPDTGGLVSVGTVTAQLMYEVREPKYLTPDVAARFDTINISQQGEDRVEVKGVKGEPAPPTTKVCINNMGGHKNSMTIVLTGLDIEEKARIVEDTLFGILKGKDQFQQVDTQLIRLDKENPNTNEEACAHLKISVLDPDATKVGRTFSAATVELALANIPGFTMTSPPGNGSPTIFHWPTLVSEKYITQKVVIGEKETEVKFEEFGPLDNPPESLARPIPDIPTGKMVKTQFGKAFATRSGDKGGNANLGVWGKTPEAYAFLNSFLTIDKLKDLLPDMEPFEIEKHELPNLLSLNFYIKGVLGEGVAASVRSDPQAKTLGEYLRAKIIE